MIFNYLKSCYLTSQEMNNGGNMKFLATLTLTALTTSSALAFDMSKYYPEEIPNCPSVSNELLEVTKFIPNASADSNSTKGTCYVKAKHYSWWDLINTQDNSYKVAVNAGTCDSKNFQNHNNIILIAAEVSYKFEISMCENNPGCHYECKPIVKLFSF